MLSPFIGSELLGSEAKSRPRHRLIPAGNGPLFHGLEATQPVVTGRRGVSPGGGVDWEIRGSHSSQRGRYQSRVPSSASSTVRPDRRPVSRTRTTQPSHAATTVHGCVALHLPAVPVNRWALAIPPDFGQAFRPGKRRK